MRVVSELAECDALPGSEEELQNVRPVRKKGKVPESENPHLAVPDGDLYARSDQGALGVGHRVVRPFVRVFPVETLGHDLVENAVHVGPDVGVVVLVQGDGG